MDSVLEIPLGSSTSYIDYVGLTMGAVYGYVLIVHDAEEDESIPSQITYAKMPRSQAWP